MQEYHFYGRRQGRPLRILKQDLMANLFPQIQVNLSEKKEFHPKAFFEKNYLSYVLEIGFGSGDNLCHQAKNNPEIGYIGLDPFINGLAHLLEKIDQNQLSNIRVSTQDARPFLDDVLPDSFSKIFALFLDPWPKKRHHKRRLITNNFIEKCATKLTQKGQLIIATDHDCYASWMKEAIMNQSVMKLIERFDTKESRPDFIPITRYEQKGLNEGRFSEYFILERKT